MTGVGDAEETRQHVEEIASTFDTALSVARGARARVEPAIQVICSSMGEESLGCVQLRAFAEVTDDVMERAESAVAAYRADAKLFEYAYSQVEAALDAVKDLAEAVAAVHRSPA